MERARLTELSDLPSPSRAFRHSRWRATWLRWIALLALAFATAPARDVTARVLSVLVVHAPDECDDDGGEGCSAGDCCPDPCEACTCCPHGHGFAVATVVALPAARLAEAELPKLRPRDVSAVGYRSPPFRPPNG